MIQLSYLYVKYEASARMRVSLEQIATVTWVCVKVKYSVFWVLVFLLSQDYSSYLMWLFIIYNNKILIFQPN